MAEVIITGNLGRDSELKYTQNGSPKLTFNVADSKSKKQDDGSWQEISSQWFRCEWWGGMAEQFANELLSGVRVKVYGTYYDRAYERDGQHQISKDVKVSAVEILTSYKDRQAKRQAPEQPDGGNWGNPPANQGGWG